MGIGVGRESPVFGDGFFVADAGPDPKIHPGQTFLNGRGQTFAFRLKDGLLDGQQQLGDHVPVDATEAFVDPLALASFHALRALSSRNDDPEKASRPFDQDRDGFVMGEGAGLLVIETLEHALERGATPLATLSGYGTSSDAYHITAGPEDGSGGAAAIKAALSRANLAPQEIGYINAHATSTPVGDQVEVAALRNVFADHLSDIPVSSTKSATGHLLGAAGGVESIFSILAVRDGVLPPTLNLEQPDQNLSDLNLIPKQSIKQNTQHALCNGLGFGGVNASLIVSRM
jgi:3-oxoacyl-[acyl-carrier-protein] synthase II